MNYQTDFEVYAGDTRTIRITVTDSATGLPVDLTNAEIKWAMARTVSAPAILEKSTHDSPFGITVVSPASAGIFEISFDPADTLNLEGRFYYEAEVREFGGAVCTVRTGRMRVWPALIPTEIP